MAVKMYHKDSKGSVDVAEGCVKTMENRDWTTDESAAKKARAAKKGSTEKIESK